MHNLSHYTTLMVFNGLSVIGLLFSLAFFRYDLKKLGVPLAVVIGTLVYLEYSSFNTLQVEAKRHTRIIAYYKIQHANFVYLYSLTHRTSAHQFAVIPTYDFEILANVIKRHEASLKFPYGCEYRGADGKLHGYPEAKARAKCITLCKNIYHDWVADGCHGNYFVVLNHTYAADTEWHKDVSAKYTKAIAKLNPYEVANR